MSFAYFAGPRMKKTGSETPAQDSENSNGASTEPVERTRLQADVAKQRVRIAKEELKRARKRLKEAQREARRAASKLESTDAAAQKTAKATSSPLKKKNELEKAARSEKAGPKNKALKPISSKGKKSVVVVLF